MRASGNDNARGLPRAQHEIRRVGQHRLRLPDALANEHQPIIIEPRFADRATRLAAIRDRWIHAGKDREVFVTKRCRLAPIECWCLNFVEDGKGLVSARGRTWLEALEQALGMLGLLAHDEKS